MAELDTLAALQSLDADVDVRRARLAEVKAALADSSEVAQARRAFEAARAKLRDDEARQRQLEWDVEERSGKIKELERRLYSGKIGNPKELTSLQTEIEHLRRDMSAIEERCLEAIAATDDQRLAVAALESGLSAVERRGAEEKMRLGEEQSKVEALLTDLQSRRTSLSSAVSSANLARYEELRRTRKGLAVARIERNTCLGCRTSLPTSQVQSARQGQVAFCSSCGRILYFAR